MMTASILTALSLVGVADASQVVTGTDVQIYYDSNSHWNDYGGTSKGFQVKHSGTWRDYSYPGTPYAAWALEYDYASSSNWYYAHYSYGTNMTVMSEDDITAGTENGSSYELDAGVLNVVKTEVWESGSDIILVTFSITNEGTSAVSNLRWFQAFDPDQDLTAYGTFTTYNDVRDLSGDGDNDWAESRGYTSGWTIGFGACDDDNTELGHFSSWSSVRDADHTLTDYGGSGADYAMGIRYEYPGTVAAGDTVETSFVVVLGDSSGTARSLYNSDAEDLCNPSCDADGDGYERESCGGEDCDDYDADVYPGADEYCNDVDDDCDGSIDERAVDMDTWYYDSDSDAYGDPDLSRRACDEPDGYTDNDEDCDDDDATINPSAAEECNGIDDDCDGEIDEDIDLDTWYYDSDGDGHGDPERTTDACEDLEGYVTSGRDCDDDDAAVYPGADEYCNDQDDDCDGYIDEGAVDASTWYDDDDSDGYGDADETARSCDEPSGYVDNDEDCDDTTDEVHPGADEYCNDRDDDCDETIDEDPVDAPTWFADSDGDGYGDEDNELDACEEPDGYTSDDEDCDDGDATIYPGATEIPYDGVDQDCDGDDLTDVDEDGYDWEGVGGEDCDDTDDTVYPGASEDADGVDEDCDDVVDEGTDWYDDDGDGFTEAGGDCDDDDEDIRPGAEETADGIDEDCDDIVDEGTTAYDDDGDGFSEDEGDCHDGKAEIFPGAEEDLTDGLDNDCDGVVDDATYDGDGDGMAEWAGDCDDSDDSVYEGATELPDGKDNDCDGITDEGTVAYDDDGDGWSEAAGDCDDTDEYTSPDATEIDGNGIDDDCDGEVDEGGIYSDDDGDGFTEEGGDCDDDDAEVNPDAEEIGDNGIDDDCDDETDETSADDSDLDGFSTEEGDCDDGDGWVYPDAPEFCDGVDNNCNGEIDEGCEELEGELEDAAKSCDGCATSGNAGAAGGGLFAIALGLLGLIRRRDD